MSKSSQMNTPNQLALQEAGEIQRRTKGSLQRIQQQLAETDEIGSLTLATLEDQGNHADRILKETRHLNDILNKTSKLQNRFAAWSFSFGSGRQAWKLARAEQKEEQQLGRIQKTTASPNKIRCQGTSIKNDAWFQEKDAPARDEEERKRLELFGAVSGEQDSKSSTGRLPDGPPLNGDENRTLRLIQADDEEIDSELENLGRHVDRLFSLASSMDEEINKQKTNLDHVAHDMEKANEKQCVINHRARLFTMSRKEKRKDPILRNKVSLLRSTAARAS
jgi:hypothetical protein